MEKILIFGGGRHAKVVIDVIEKMEQFEVEAIVDPKLQPNSRLLGYPVINDDSQWVASGPHKGIVAIGDNRQRERVVEKILGQCQEFEFISAIHPSVVLGKNVSLGQGTVVVAGGIINVDTKIGHHVIVNTRASIDHDNTIGDFASLGPGVTTGGSVDIGERSHIGLGANVIEKVKIGADTIVGAGSVVIKNLPSDRICFGNPCREIRPIDREESYLR